MLATNSFITNHLQPTDFGRVQQMPESGSGPGALPGNPSRKSFRFNGEKSSHVEDCEDLLISKALTATNSSTAQDTFSLRVRKSLICIYPVSRSFGQPPGEALSALMWVPRPAFCTLMENRTSPLYALCSIFLVTGEEVQQRRRPTSLSPKPTRHLLVAEIRNQFTSGLG
jgi:hypothetical protein